MTARATGAAEAKINLGLRILGRRDDGYHDIRSIFHSISLADLVTVELTDGARGVISLEVEGGFGTVPRDGSNLVWKAAKAFLDASGLVAGVSLRIEKHIPPGGGLGGGSSDAACTLRLLRDLSGLDPGLESLAISIGSDVPFFLRGGAALVEGRGERITPIRAGDFWAVVLNPGVSSPTAQAYADWDMRHSGLTIRHSIYDLRTPELAWHEGKPFPVSLCNDFLPLLVERFPVMAEIADGLDRCAPVWGLSGSGSSFYALFKTAWEAEILEASVPRRFSPVVCRATGSAGVSSNW